jgi:hypothetical protein
MRSSGEQPSSTISPDQGYSHIHGVVSLRERGFEERGLNEYRQFSPEPGDDKH